MPIVQDELDAARRFFLKQRPFFAPFLLRCHLLPVEGTEVYCDRHWRIYIGKDWPLLGSDKNARIPRLAAAIYHELLHLLQNHFQRGKHLNDIDHEAWLLACECEINDDLIADLVHDKHGMIFPTEGIWPAKLKLQDGLTAEEYWTILHRRQAGARPIMPRGSKCCGGGSSVGKSHPGELAADDARCPAASDLDRGAALRELARQAVDWHGGRTPGTLPGWLQNLAGDFVAVAVPWYRRLERHLREALSTGGDDYCWNRPNRRNPCPGDFFLPGLVAYTGELGILVDTSGSMSSTDLAEAFSTIKEIIRRIGGNGSCIRLLVCDTRAKDAGRMYSAYKISLQALEVPRGGGTDLRVGIALAEKLSLRTLLVLTDGHTPWPDCRPRLPVFVALLGDHAPGVPPWATRVTVERSCAP